MKKGKVIVLEGLDGSGKGTQHRLLTKALNELGYNVLTKEIPDYDLPSGKVVKKYLEGQMGKDPYSVSYKQTSSFYGVNRLEVYLMELKEKYERGFHLIFDRWTSSNMLYQGAKKQGKERLEAVEWIRKFEHEDLELPSPDKVIFLDVPAEVAKFLLELRYDGDESKKDINERNFAYQIAARETGLECADKYGWHIIQCATPDYKKILENGQTNELKIMRDELDIQQEVLEKTLKVLIR